MAASDQPSLHDQSAEDQLLYYCWHREHCTMGAIFDAPDDQFVNIVCDLFAAAYIRQNPDEFTEKQRDSAHDDWHAAMRHWSAQARHIYADNFARCRRGA